MRSASCRPTSGPSAASPSGCGCSIRRHGGSRSGRRAAGRAARPTAAGPGSSSTSAALVDTNVLVYRFDARFPEKQRRATRLLRDGIAGDRVRVPHQALVEFVAAVTRPQRGGAPILPVEAARREAEELLSQFQVLYPTEGVVRTAPRGAAAYQLSWFDAHIWAYAEFYGLEQLVSEDFEHDRLYGTVRAVDPFR